jgi:hypothetical protein
MAYNETDIWDGLAVTASEETSTDVGFGDDARGFAVYMLLTGVAGTYAVDVWLWGAFREVKTGSLTDGQVQIVDFDFAGPKVQVRVTPAGGGTLYGRVEAYGLKK